MKSSVFSNLKMQTLLPGLASTGVNALFSLTNYRKRGEKLKFYSSRGYSNVYVYAAKRTMMQETFAKINDLYPKHLRQEEMEQVWKHYKSNRTSLRKIIVDNKKVDNKDSENKVSLKYRGKDAEEGLLLWIKNDTNTPISVPVQMYWDKIKTLSNEAQILKQKLSEDRKDRKDFNEGLFDDTVIKVPAIDEAYVFLDLGANVSMQSNNNLVLTTVQGRDRTRKELISGGDLSFTVKGKIVSNFPDEYPKEAVSRFLTLMQHKGVIQVYNLLFNQFNVTQILIKDFQMSQNTGYKNEQPYSFTCVAVEQDKAIKAVEDTIDTLNIQLANKKDKGWKKVLLDNVKKSAADKAAQTIEILTANTI